MKELIKSIVANLSMKSKEIRSNDFYFLFISYDERDERQDFFLFQFTDYDKLLEYSEGVGKIEYHLNSIIKDLKEKFLSKYRERFIDNNLSLVVLLDTSGRNDNELSKIHQIEENNILIKKYILNYNQDEFSCLNKRIGNTSAVVEKLNSLIIEHSEMLKFEHNYWYHLLLRLFIKIPFLNYSPRNKQSLHDLSELISKKLDENQLGILKIIDEESEDFSSIDIEEFIYSHNLINDRE